VAEPGATWVTLRPVTFSDSGGDSMNAAGLSTTSGSVPSKTANGKCIWAAMPAASRRASAAIQPTATLIAAGAEPS
jgi:hypothetical protein